MDRLVAFAAGAVLAFGVGWFVSYHANREGSSLPEVPVTPEELEIAGDEAGLVDDAEPSTEHTLGDIAREGDVAALDDMSDAELVDIKKQVLPLLTAADIAQWREARAAYVVRYLMENGELWAVGTDEAKSPRFEDNVVETALGRYTGKVTVQLPGATAPKPTDLALTLAGYKAEDGAKNRLVVGAWSADFLWKHIGTDGAVKVVDVLWPNADPASKEIMSHLGLRLPADMKPGEAQTGDVLGLSEELKWVKVGTFELAKAP